MSTGDTVGIDLADKLSRYCILDEAGVVVPLANGLVDVLNPNLSGVPYWTYNADGEGRPGTVHPHCVSFLCVSFLGGSWSSPQK